MKTLLHSYLSNFIYQNGERTTHRIDFIRINDKTFKISCDSFYQQIVSIVNKISFEHKIPYDSKYDRIPCWRV